MHANLDDWLATPQGRLLLARERQAYDQETADIFGYHAVQIGFNAVDLLGNCRIPTRVRLGAGGDLVADPAFLPFDAQSVDLVALPHALEFSTTPHQLLREVERVLRPEGQLLLSGFNPHSLLALPRLRAASRRGYPWCGQYLSLPRVKDWLSLLGFEVTAGRLFGYLPPVATERWLDRLGFLEAAGDRWWPVFGGVYFLAAKKRVPGLRIIRPAWQTQVARAAAQPLPCPRDGSGADTIWSESHEQ